LYLEKLIHNKDEKHNVVKIDFHVIYLYIYKYINKLWLTEILKIFPQNEG